MEIDRALLMRTFVAEAEEQLVSMEQGLVAIELDPTDAEVLAAIFRAAHTLKGNAAVVGLQLLAQRTDAVEETLAALREGSQAVTPELISTLFGAVDELRQELRRSLSLEDGQSAGLLSSSSGSGGASGTLRIDATKLDRMLSLSGEISIARGRLRTQLQVAGKDALEHALDAHLEADRLYRELQDEIMRARLVPLGPIFRQYQRVVRDLALEHGKRAELVIEGEGVEIDTTVGEQVRGPLMHMLRNALDHGIEQPAVRRALGKSPTGRITLGARRDASHIVIELRDDGAGFSRRRIAARAGLPVGSEPGLADGELLRLVLQPGFSTKETASDLSGRGVGMDVVRKNIEALRGSVAIESEEGAGSRITLRLPLTLAIIDGFYVEVAGETYVIPLETLTECQELDTSTVRHEDGCGVLNFRGEALPYLRLRELFELGGAPGREHVAIVRSGDRHAGIAVDTLLGQDQAVIKPLSSVFRHLPAVAGSTITGSGRVALILDVAELLRLAETRNARAIHERETH